MKISKILLASGIIGLLSSNVSAGESSLWNTNWEKLSLTQNGSSITGRYTYYTENQLIHGQIRGILDGNLVKGWWKQSNMPCGLDSAWDGPFALLFDEDGKLFIGDWGGCSETLEEMNPSDKTWNGVLVEGKLELGKLTDSHLPPFHCTPSDKKNDSKTSPSNAEVSSEWNTNWDKLFLTRKGSSITGNYTYYSGEQALNGQVIGTLEGNILKGWWKQSGNPNCGPDNAWDGPFAFQFAEDGKSFVGDWGGCSETLENMNPSEKTWNGTLFKGKLKNK